MTLKDGKKLDNILSVSTAASNKYLFHFDSYHALSQWTAGIRLAMYEHTSLSEAYTGALIAGKGKTMNNIRALLDRQCAVYDDWVRVRFGAGTPWRRCWCVVSPPDQKEYAKLQKTQKKSNMYERPTVLKGDIKFYESKKIKKNTKPIATVKDAYSCYAIYPQSKPLIDQSTLVKIEGKITIHSNPESTTEGFVFVMPEARPAITGFEIMLQYLFPVFDTFNLYGRPKKLVADVLDTRGLMFGMPPDRRYGYLEIWDVVGLINTDGSSNWSERQWRKQLKELTSTRMSAGSDSDFNSARTSRRNTVSRAGPRGNLRFDDQGSVRSNPSTRRSSPSRQARIDLDPQGPRRAGTAPAAGPFSSPRHQRSVSETNGYQKYQAMPARYPQDQGADAADNPPAPPPHGVFNGTSQYSYAQQYREGSDSDESPIREPRDLPELPIAPSAPPHGPVDAPPAFAHAPYQQPPIRPSLPYAMKPNADVDSATLQQMADASNAPLPPGIAAAGAAAAWRSQDSIQSRRSGDYNSYGESGQQMYLSAPSRPPPTDRNSGSRLATIPASPYVEHAEFVQPSGMYQPTAPPVPEHAQMEQQGSSVELPYRPQSGSGSGQVQRKPVPGRSPSASIEDDARSTTSSSLDSLRNDIIDIAALDALNHEESMQYRQPSASSSVYDDDALSTSTPDYASVASEEIQPRKLPSRPADRPRSGVLKIVGDPNLKLKSDIEEEVATFLAANKEPAANDVPTFDFGPTFSLPLEAKRPGTSGTMTQAMHDGNFSHSNENLAATPNEQRRQSYISGRTTPNATLHLRSSSGSPNAPDSRTVPWQPVTIASQQQQPDRQKLDPEEWVKQRANQQPHNYMYGHGRANSYTPPPLGGRQRSGDWSHLQRASDGSPAQGRPPSRPLSRPQSRGAEAILDQRPTSLSAFEQEQVARLTNTTLLSGVTGHKKQQPSQGLTGYIDYREKEKAAAKASRTGHSTAMQAEIDRRLLQNQQKQIAEAQARQRQIVEMQQLQMQQQQQQMQANLAQSSYGYGNSYHAGNPTGAPSVLGMSSGSPSVMGMPSGPPSVMGMPSRTPSLMGMPTGPGTPQGMVGMAYSSPHQLQQQQTYQGQGYFQQPVMTPNTNMMPGGWGSPSPQTPQGQYFQQPQQQMSYGQQQQPTTQPYGASFDQAQAAARQGQHQSQFRR
jgi:CCR4-NOT transcriptional complex subunit CAF120